MNKKDAIFFKNFSFLIGFLIILTAVLALLGAFMNSAIIKERKLDRSLIEKNLRPVAAVHTEANPPAQPEKTPSTQANEADPASLYQEACAACHGSGVAGAPTLDSDDWKARLAKGGDVLVQHAIQGFNAMPPKGGRADLSDEQITQLVEYMMGENPAPEESTADEAPKNPNTVAPVANNQNKEERIKHGQQIYQQACFACHGTGAAGAPKLEKSAWKVRLTKGAEILYNNSLHGIGVMPPKGGRMDLSDDDVKAAVDYMISQVQ